MIKNYLSYSNKGSINPFISQGEEDRGFTPIFHKSGHGSKDRVLNVQGGILSGRWIHKEGPETKHNQFELISPSVSGISTMQQKQQTSQQLMTIKTFTSF